MTSRRKNKKDTASEDGTSGAQSPGAVTGTGRPKRTRTSTGSSNDSPSSPPRKGKRNASADSDDSSTPRKGGRGRGRGTPRKESPPASRGRGRGRRGSTDSSASVSSVGGSSVVSSASTPSTRRSGRNRRGSSSSEASVLSDVNVTPPDNAVQQTGRGRKRGAAKSPTVVAKKTNGNSPSKSTPRKRGRKASPEVPSVDNAAEKNGHSKKEKGTVAESPPEKVLDGGTDKLLEKSGELNTEHNSSTTNGKNVLENHNDSSQLQNTSKRRLSNGTASDVERSPDRKPKPDKRIKPVNDVIIKSDKTSNVSSKKNDCDIKSVVSDVVNNSADCDMDTHTVADTMLRDIELNEEQVKEFISLIPPEILDGQEEIIIEKIVSIMIEGTVNNLKHMNAPRFNKFLRQLLNRYCDLDCKVDKKYALCQKCVDWAKEKKLVNLRHELEVASMEIYYKSGEYRKAEEMANALYSETKKLQDKEKNVKACLCLSQTYQAMGNISKARANITTAKTEALKIYTPPNMQGELDMQSGIMQVAEGKDIETAYSYFKEAALGFTQKKKRSRALKYMLLTKIMVNKADEGEKVVRSSSHLADIDEGVEAMLSITKAANMSSLKEFKTCREKYAEHLEGDPVVASVLDELYTSMMEKNMLKIIMPYERVQIGHLAEQINLPRLEVERRLSQMILDKRLSAQLDHRDDCLYLYNSQDKDLVYSSTLETLTHLDKTVTHLNLKVRKIL